MKQNQEVPLACEKCGKTIAAGQLSGDLISHLLQDNYCRCNNTIKIDQINDRYEDKINNKKDDKNFCPRCGLNISTPSQPGSLTGYLFQDVRCKCQSDEDFAPGAMTGKFWKLKKAGSGTIFVDEEFDGVNTLHASGQRKSQLPTINLAPGAIIGGAYRILGLIGQGGMGEVYLAEHMTLGKQCALKLIPPDQVTAIGWRRFQQEARAIAKLEHINLVKVSDLGIHEGCLPFYAMEFIQGQTLADMLAEQSPLPLPLIVVLEIFAQVCDGVDDAHRAGVIHRDLKPANIMVSKQGNKIAVKILDFGLAKLSQQDRDKQSLTSVGEIFGSPFYMSPEQCSGEKVDNRSDIYSIGCSMFECLTGRPPFTGHLSSAIVFSHQEADPPSLASIVGAKVYPDSLEVVMAKLLRKNPVERYQNLTELRGDLERVSRGETVMPYYRSRSAATPVGAVESGGATEYKPQGKAEADQFARLKVMIVVVVVVVVAVLLIVTAGGGFLYYKDKSHSPAKLSPNKKTTTAASEGNEAIFKELGQQISAEESTAAKPKSADVTTPYSTIEVQNGRRVRIFDFPTDIEIGGIKTEADDDMIVAHGKMIFPADMCFYFSPSPRIARIPSYFARFRHGEILGLVLARPVEINDMLQSLKQLPDLATIKVIRFKQSNPIDFESVKVLSRCMSVMNFSCNESGIPQDLLCRIGFLKKLDHIGLQRYQHTDKILALLATSTMLDEIDLAFAKVSDDGLRAIAKMPNLKKVHLEEAINTPERLEILLDAPKLEGLWLGDTVQFDEKTLAIIRRFKHLKNLGVTISSPTRLAITKRKMLSALSGLRVEFVNNNQGVEINEVIGEPSAQNVFLPKDAPAKKNNHKPDN